MGKPLTQTGQADLRSRIKKHLLKTEYNSIHTLLLSLCNVLTEIINDLVSNFITYFMFKRESEGLSPTEARNRRWHPCHSSGVLLVWVQKPHRYKFNLLHYIKLSLKLNDDSAGDSTQMLHIRCLALENKRMHCALNQTTAVHDHKLTITKQKTYSSRCTVERIGPSPGQPCDDTQCRPTTHNLTTHNFL